MEVSVFDIPLPADNQQSGDSSESIGSENNQYFTQQETLQKQNDNFGSADISEDDQSNDIIYPFGSKRLKPDDYSNPLCDLLPFDGVMSSPPPELSSEIVCEGTTLH